MKKLTLLLIASLGTSLATTAIAAPTIRAYFDSDKSGYKFSNRTNHKVYVRVCVRNGKKGNFSAATKEHFNVAEKGTQEIEYPSSPKNVAYFVFDKDGLRDNSECGLTANNKLTAYKSGTTLSKYEASIDVNFKPNFIEFHSISGNNSSSASKIIVQRKYRSDQHQLKFHSTANSTSCVEYDSACGNHTFQRSLDGGESLSVKSDSELCNQKQDVPIAVKYSLHDASCKSVRDNRNGIMNYAIKSLNDQTAYIPPNRIEVLPSK